MRSPIKDVFTAESLSHGRLSIVMGIGFVANVVLVYVLASFLAFHYAKMCNVRDDCDQMNFMDTVPGLEVLSFFLFLIAMTNIAISYMFLVFVDMAEVRVLLRRALHVAVWVFALLVARVGWFVVTLFLAVFGSYL